MLVRALSRKPGDQQRGDGEDDEDGRQVDDPALARRLRDRVRQREAEGGVEQLVEVAAPADRDGRDRHAVLEDQVPADDPGDQLAHRRVGVGVGAARDRDRRRHLGVGQRGERAGHAGEDEREDDRRPGVADRLAQDDEDAGADDRAEAERGEVEQADRALERVVAVLRVGDEGVDGLGGERAAARRGGGGHADGSCGGVMTRTGRRERSISRVVTFPRNAPCDPAAARRAGDDQVRLLLLREHEHAAHDGPGTVVWRGVDAPRRDPLGHLRGRLRRALGHRPARHRRQRLELDPVHAQDGDLGSHLLRDVRGGVGEPGLVGACLRSNHDAFHAPALSASPRGETHAHRSLTHLAVGSEQRGSVRGLPYC